MDKPNLSHSELYDIVHNLQSTADYKLARGKEEIECTLDHYKYGWVIKRVSDNTYWQISQSISMDGTERHKLATVDFQVEPYEVTVTKYRRVES